MPRRQREPNNLKADGTPKPCAFYASFCGEKTPIYGRKKGAKDKQPRRSKRVVGGAIIPSGKDVGSLEGYGGGGARHSLHSGLVAPDNSRMGVGTQQAWYMPPAVSRSTGFDFFVM
jgi:hypothetical protein